ncbi:hypothetical protein GH714_008996 [Hevea brasiliensis]|uniref:Uncharacterized protein n=1 Tax=Hevea brasiliensis TaxID=3981 RepID=A0A6A6N139_HEVBR|nr:hypothetical protein GH714_008996 [Hevea brasiliensis]
MENTKNLHDMEDFDFDDDEDALSLCDLPLSQQETESNTSLYEQQRSDSHPDFFFEFSTSPCLSDTDCPTPDSLRDLPLSHQETESNTSVCDQQGSDSHPDFLFEFYTSPCSLDTDCPTPDNIIFCGKILSCKNEEPTNNYDNKPVQQGGSSANDDVAPEAAPTIVSAKSRGSKGAIMKAALDSLKESKKSDDESKPANGDSRDEPIPRSTSEHRAEARGDRSKDRERERDRIKAQDHGRGRDSDRERERQETERDRDKSKDQGHHIVQRIGERIQDIQRSQDVFHHVIMTITTVLIVDVTHMLKPVTETDFANPAVLS